MPLSRTYIADHLVNKKVTIAPLVTFRVLFGLLMLVSVIRFWVNGWIHALYVAPKVYFPFIEGIQPLSGTGMYFVFAALALFAAFIAFGLCYRISAISFFLLFTYVELIDKSNYLNHYYFVSLIGFLLIWLPANGDFSLDVKLGLRKKLDLIPIGFINILKFQVGVLYLFAGIAKINPDWLLRAQPMKMWLSANAYKPVVGWLFRYKITAFGLSWIGMIYDITIPFFLSKRSTRFIAYAGVVLFHLMTWWLFPIGMFPFIMIAITTIYFSPETHDRWLTALKHLFRWQSRSENGQYLFNQPLKFIFAAFVVLQVILPMRYLAYPGDLFWTEQGYRFSWRVMLMEKAGQATFFVSDQGKEGESVVANYEHLTPQQEKMMATQPDMIVQFARKLETIYLKNGMSDPVVRAEVYVTLNGRPSRLFINPHTDLTEVKNDWSHKDWVLAND
ncbi:MAG: HTTM domain-containing protein [Marinoscillum sp.]